MTCDEFFAGQDESRQIFDVVLAAVEALGAVEIRVSKSQIGFRHRLAFGSVWMPEQYLHRKAAPLVLTLALRRRDPSPRWKEIVEPTPGRFTHHLELYSPKEMDAEARAWLQEAYAIAE